MKLHSSQTNVYRSRLVGQFLQNDGIPVIPTVSWAEPATFEFCFDGLEINSVLAVSTIGVKREEYSFDIWEAGMDEMIKRLKPAALLVDGGEVEYNYNGIKTVFYENKVTERIKTVE